MKSEDTAGQTGSAATRFSMRFLGTLHGSLYRLSRGKIGGKLGQLPVLLLTTTGRKSGQPRTWPLGYLRDGERLIIVASASGEPKHPAWYLNLRADPRVTVQLGGEEVVMYAKTATGAERVQLWDQLIVVFPAFAEYQQKTAREIPVVILSKEITSP